MKMNENDYVMYSSNEQGLYVVAHFSGMGLEWPHSITYKGKKFIFEANELMEHWMIGTYSGHSHYVLAINS